MTYCGVCGTDHHLAEVKFFLLYAGLSLIDLQGDFLGKFPVRILFCEIVLLVLTVIYTQLSSFRAMKL